MEAEAERDGAIGGASEPAFYPAYCVLVRHSELTVDFDGFPKVGNRQRDFVPHSTNLYNREDDRRRVSGVIVTVNGQAGFKDRRKDFEGQSFLGGTTCVLVINSELQSLKCNEHVSYH